MLPHNPKYVLDKIIKNNKKKIKEKNKKLTP